MFMLLNKFNLYTYFFVFFLLNKLNLQYNRKGGNNSKY
jgi:hypothetical protein